VSIRLRVSVEANADPMKIWTEMTDWVGQSRWIPLTTVRIVSEHNAGLGVRAAALSGFWLGRIPVGLLDNFVVTGWSPPDDGSSAELEVLHLGPYFTGEGAFLLERVGAGTRITATEVFSLPGGRGTEAVVRLALPIMRRCFEASLWALKKIVEHAAHLGQPT
jgi:hypothetical protein